MKYQLIIRPEAELDLVEAFQLTTNPPGVSVYS